MGWFKKLVNTMVESKGCCSGHATNCCAAPAETGYAMKKDVRKQYGALIKAGGASSGCCSSSGVAVLAGYTAEQLESVPENMRNTSFACGNPVTFSEVKAGQVVLDIGSGAGLDVILAARKVGPTGKVIGLDMTPEMIETARANARHAGLENVEFRLGDAEAMPVADNSCDWIVSNCVINLAPNKARVFREAFRVLKPGGRLMVSDLVTHELPPEVRASMAAWVSCVGGALEETDYLEVIKAAGFENVEVAARLAYDSEILKSVAGSCCLPEGRGELESALAALGSQIDGHVSSVRVSAAKPLRVK